MKSFLLHGLNQDMLEYLKEIHNSLLTFDDGLASVYKYRNDLKKITSENNLKVILFINPGILLQAPENNILDFIRCSVAHEKIRENSREGFLYFMNLNQLKEMISLGYEVGFHSYDHFLFTKKPKRLKDQIKIFSEDINKQIKFAEENNIDFKYFAWPYNEEIPIYKTLLIKEFGDIKFYGKERLSLPFFNLYEK